MRLGRSTKGSALPQWEDEIPNSSMLCPVVLRSNVRRDVYRVSVPAEEFAEMLDSLRNADPEQRLSGVVCETPSARPVNGRAARQRPQKDWSYIL